MIRKIRKNIEKIRVVINSNICLTKKTKSSKTGQVAIILLLLVAVALIMYAVTLNLNKTSKTKTLVTIASNIGVARLVSQMASYGYQLLEVQLGGKTKICAWTGFFKALIGFVLAVLVIWIPGIGPALATWLMVTLTVASALTVLMQALILDPGITSFWNSNLMVNLPLQDRFLEQGIQTALVKAVTDNDKVPDLHDYDQDGQFGIVAGKPVDAMNRFGFYYTKRLLSAQPPNIPEVVTFYNALQNLVYDKGVGDWGLYDNSANNYCDDGLKTLSECNICCTNDTTVGDFNLPRTEMGCNPTSLSDMVGCIQNSPYYVNLFPPVWPWVYEQLQQNPLNNDTTLSFLEQLGVDDEHKGFCKQANGVARNTYALGPNGRQKIYNGTTCLQRFRAQDATGFYPPPADYLHPQNGEDPFRGIFPFFYKISDWGLDLNTFSPDPDVTGEHIQYPEQCYWINNTTTECNSFNANLFFTTGLSQLSGLHDPVTNYLEKEITPTVDGTSSNDFINDPAAKCGAVDASGASISCTWNSGEPPIAIDRFRMPNGIDDHIGGGDIAGKIAGDPIQCSQNVFFDNPASLPPADTGLSFFFFSKDPSPSIGFWKRGRDMNCSNFWPYNTECPKSQGTTCQYVDPYDTTSMEDLDCECSDVVSITGSNSAAELFPDDSLDDMIEIIKEFIITEEAFFKQYPPDDMPKLKTEFLDWYQQMAFWIEPNSLIPDQYPYSFYNTWYAGKDSPPGVLWLLLSETRMIKKRLMNSLVVPFVSAIGGNGEQEVWCIPELGNSLVQPDEQGGTHHNNFNVFSLSVRGDVWDIIECLERNIDYNIRGEYNPNPHASNYDRFKACNDQCINAGTYFPQIAGLAGEPTIEELKEYFYQSNRNCGKAEAFSGYMPRSLLPGFNPTDDYSDASIDYDSSTNSYSGNLDELIDCKTTCFDNIQNMIDGGYECKSIDPNTGNFVPCADSTPPQTTCACKQVACEDDCISKYNTCMKIAIGITSINKVSPTLVASNISNSARVSSNVEKIASVHTFGMAEDYFDYNDYAEYPANNVFAGGGGGGGGAGGGGGGNAAAIAACVAARDLCLDPGTTGYDPIAAPWGDGCDSVAWMTACQDDCASVTSTSDFLNAECTVNGIGYNCLSDVLSSSEVSLTFILPDGTSLGSHTTGPSQKYYDGVVSESGSCSADNIFSDNYKNYQVPSPFPPVAQQIVWDEYPNLITRSMNEAYNQVIKMQKRVDYLKPLFWANYPDNQFAVEAGTGKPLGGEIFRIIKIFSDANENLTKFLVDEKGPAQQLILARRNYEAQSPLGDTVIYGWQDPATYDKTKSPPVFEKRGLWHIVEVTARQPGRCYGACSPNQKESQSFPYVRTYTKNWGTKRCYEMTADRGTAKMRVTRFDESSSSLNILRFPNGVPIWNFRGSPKSEGINLDKLVDVCGRSSTWDPSDWVPDAPVGLDAQYDTYEGAFIINKPRQNQKCWDASKQLLQKGVSTETCAQYYHYSGGFSMKFVPCAYSF